MAYYNPTTDEIVGAECGSWTYLHEERHREQYKNNTVRMFDLLHVNLYWAAIIAGTIGVVAAGWQGWALAVGIAMTPHVLGLAYLEVDASVVATWRWFRA